MGLRDPPSGFAVIFHTDHLVTKKPIPVAKHGEHGEIKTTANRSTCYYGYAISAYIPLV
ncbi:hypothetical protein Ark11_1578 [Candidatus Ichthyocystis hellenicum]|uniref:Uncharacterized protein n=1 Tax=Candidatus Ichthyocystis hellenicum TaxID=1561003 RepID=A0A0S4M3M6_9BURK|nr:hypothetical protein [Candidatus Ichthyocystis hellenicum]CUT18371.1 hypothetical protein Ark11_1578 [Candidatus Ichthyocystis hellenicum]